MTQQRIVTKYFNRIAEDWQERAYNPRDEYLHYPAGKVRQDIVTAEIERLAPSGNIIDLGCGTGELVIDLLLKRHNVIGIDIAPAMIKEATNKLDNIGLTKTEHIFRVGNAMSLRLKQQFDIVIALGLIEYLVDTASFLKAVKRLLSDKGYAFIECRNQLFNICSGNRYTLEEIRNNELGNLISELRDIEKYSPIHNVEVPRLYAGLLDKAEKFSDIACLKTPEIPPIEYPKGLNRKQHTPLQLDKMLYINNLELQYVIYYHYHSLPPAWETIAPQFYNKLSLHMQPLGYTPLGATTCSSFIAIIKNTKQ